MTCARAVGRLLTLFLLLPGLVLVTGAGSASAQKIKPGFWGMHDSDWTSTPDVPVGSANFTTSGTYWPNVETSDGQYSWTRLDAQVAAAEEVGAQPMIVLGQSPQFASTAPESPDFRDHMPKVKLWKRYVSAVADRYGARLDYQIWPEPNITENWKGTPKQMAVLTAAASKAIAKQAGKSAKVVSPAVALRMKYQQRWTIKYFKQKVDRKRVHTYVDAIAIDPFPEKKGSPEDSYAIMRSIKKQLARIGVRTPIWNNEINYGVEGGGQPTDVTYPVAKQQSFVVRTYALSAAAGMQRTYWLGWFATETMAVRMVDSDGATLPPGESYEVVRSWLNKTNVQGAKKLKNGVWVVTAKKGRREVRRIYWKPSGSARIALPKSATRLEDQDGGTDRTPPRRTKVDYRPVMVAAKK